MMQFETWLKKQKERDDPIGDLAKDYISDDECIKLTKIYLERKRVHAIVIDAFKDAVTDYLKYVRKELNGKRPEFNGFKE